MKKLKSVSIISLGPGGSSMITQEGAAALRDADVVFCPKTKEGSRAAVVLESMNLKTGAVRSYSLPMSKDRTKAYQAYDEVHEEVVRLRSEGLSVAIVAEGDAGFYSSTTYLSEKLKQADIPVQQLAGIPAFIAAAASIGLPVVEQEDRLTVWPGKVNEAMLNQVEAGNEVAVVMKLSQCEAELKEFIRSDRRLVWHYFENVGTSDRFYTCDKKVLLDRKFPYFSLLIIKKQ